MTEAVPVDSRLPGAQDEFEALHEKIWPLIERRQDLDGKGEGDTVRISIDLPVEWMWLAAWLTIKDRMRRHGELGPVTGDITHHERLVRHHAKTYIARLIDYDMHMQLTELANGAHPVLYPPPQKPAAAEMDDEIPF